MSTGAQTQNLAALSIGVMDLASNTMVALLDALDRAPEDEVRRKQVLHQLRAVAADLRRASDVLSNHTERQS